MSQTYPDLDESQDSKDGTASHECGANLIPLMSCGTAYKLSDFVGTTASNGVVMTEAMVEGAELYARDVAAVMGTIDLGPGAAFGIESRVYATRIHPESWGTPDAWVYDRIRRILYVWDYKFGRRYIDEYENWQLINYAAGILDKLGINGAEDQNVVVKMRVIQPRAYGPRGSIREWSVKACDLRGHFNTLRQNAEIALSDKAEFKSGPHCRDCPGRHACDAALQGGWQLYEASTAPIPQELDPLQLGTQLDLVRRAIQQLEYLETGYAAQVEHIVRKSGRVPGYGVETTFGRLAWAKPLKEVVAMGLMFDHDLIKEECITPTKAIELGIDAAIVNGYSTKRTTGVKVKRINENDIKRLF